MGGNLFKLGRIGRERYFEIETDLRVYLDGRIPDAYRIPRFYGSKADFGDVDIIVSDEVLAESDWQTLRREISEDLGIERTASTGHVFSTVYRDFQVDFFLRPAATFEATYNFLSFNDLGNLLGRIFRRLGLKYGEKGLEFVFRRAQASYRRDLPVSTDIKRILEFIELDHAIWRAGFETLDEMYAWLVTSPYFSVEPYRKLGATMRKRASVRPTVARFLTWIEDEGVDKVCVYAPREVCFARVCEAFPEARLEEAICDEEAREARALAVRERFRGDIVMELFPKLRGRPLGGFIKDFKETFTDFEAEVSALSPEDVRKMILGFGRARGDE